MIVQEKQEKRVSLHVMIKYMYMYVRKKKLVCQEKPVSLQVVIKYVPFVGDSKRALDEYTSEIFMGGLNTIVLHNTCEDSLLAAPIILDLVILAELCERIEVKRGT